MNPPRRQWPNGYPQPIRPESHKPAVAQTKVAAPRVNLPVAPPVYRPQPTPVVLQRKGATVQAIQSPRRPVAPPVYSPQAVPKVLQTKQAAHARPPSVAKQAPTAPPPYRPAPASRVFQAKSAHPQGTPDVKRPPAPSPHRSAQGGGVIQRIFEFDHKQYDSEDKIIANKKLAAYLRNNDIYTAAVKLAKKPGAAIEFKNLGEIKAYLSSTPEFAEALAADATGRDANARALEAASKMAKSIGAAKKSEVKYMTVNSWGHIFERHGSQIAGAKAVERAKTRKERASGVWVDNEGAVVFLTQFFLRRYTPDGFGIALIPIDVCVGLEYLATGATRPCRGFFYKFNDMGGYITAFPTNQTNVHGLSEEDKSAAPSGPSSSASPLVPPSLPPPVVASAAAASSAVASAVATPAPTPATTPVVGASDVKAPAPVVDEATRARIQELIAQGNHPINAARIARGKTPRADLY